MRRDCDNGARRNAQGLLRPGERRRPPHVDDARALLRGLARVSRGPRCGLGLDLRRRRQRMAWRGRLAQRRSRRDVGALERGPRLRRGQRAPAVQGLGPAPGARPPARGRGGLWCVREPRRGQDVVPAQHARRSAGPRRLEHPGQSASRAPRAPGPAAASGRGRPVLGRDPGLRHLRDDRQRRLVDAAQPRAARRLATREPRGRLLRAQARHVAHGHRAAVSAEPRRHAPQ